MEEKKENIAEYIIQIYRKEDLMRAFEFDLEKIGNHVINHLPISNMEKLAKVNDYEKMIAQMKAQNIEQFGHLQEVKESVMALETLHHNLISTDLDYQKIHDKAAPYIAKNMELSGGKITSEIEICLNGIYGFLLLKLDGKKIDDANQKAIDKFGDILSYLSFKYDENIKLN